MEKKTMDLRKSKRYREGFRDFQAAYTVKDKCPDTPYENGDKISYLHGWLDARTKARLGSKIVDWC